MNCDVLTRYLDLYLDGELAVEERAEVEAHLRACEDCRGIASIEARLRAAVRHALGAVRAPRSLHDHVARRLRDHGRWSESQRTMVLAWAAVALVVIGVGYAATMVVMPGRDPAADAVAAHVAATDSEVWGDRGHVTDFLLAHAPFAPRVPIEDREGVRLVGARVAQLGATPAVVYLYDVGGRRVSIAQYRSAEDQGPSMTLDHREGYAVATWRDRDLTQTVVGDLPDHEVRQFIPASFGN